jgi:D-threonate/D-erythronate kinase
MLAIVADDLTGACDTGALFAGRGFVPVSVWPRPAATADVRVMDTESRATDAATATRRVAQWAAVPARRYFKKIDSTLRGHIGAEVDALLAAVPASGALLCPAFPAQGRRVLDHILTVDGRPFAETPLARDPTAPPAATRTSSVVELLRGQTDRPVEGIALTKVRAGGPALAAHLHALGGTLAIADAETDGDLDALVDAALALDPAPLLVGAAGLARALAARLGVLVERVDLPPCERWLIVAGSRHPATRGQVAAARAAGLRVLATADRDAGDRGRVGAGLAAAARAALAHDAFDIVAVTGGETAIALFDALAAERLDLIGPPAPGLALGYLRGGDHPDQLVLTKAGGFGADDLFVTLAAGRAR